MDLILNILRQIWEEWNVRCAVLASLFFQILLISLASQRKRSEKQSMHMIIWFAYLMADWIAIYAIGITLNIARNDCKEASEKDPPVALWAPFLLLHLGGPDTITAFSLVDNQLWIRHLVRLVVELVMVAYVFHRTIHHNSFWIPTVLVFIAGAIKYGGRVQTLYLACLDNMKDAMRLERDEDGGNSEVAISMWEPENLLETEIVQEGYKYYTIFRGLIVDHMFTSVERRESRDFFSRLDSNEAFKVMEVELNFMYDELFTKMATVHRSCYGFYFRFAAFALMVVALVLFASHKKPNNTDIAATYVLLSGAVILEIVALIKILLSDWTIAYRLKSLGVVIYSIRKKMTMEFLQARWSECICEYNLINYCLKKRFEWLDKTIDRFGLKSTYDELRYKGHWDVSEELKKFVYDELKEKAWYFQGKRAAKMICNSRGRRASHESVMWSVSQDVEYDESVLLWHIATDLLYFTHAAHHPVREGDKPDHRELCKKLSDYMLYLLIMRPALMSAVAGVSQIRFKDTCREAMNFFHVEKSITEQKEACEKLLTHKFRPMYVDPETLHSVLPYACTLAKDLRAIDNSDDMWEMMSKVWLELLWYGASNCESSAHAQQLSKGGELITFVWLLMAHLGLGTQLWMESRAKLNDRLGRGEIGL